MRRRTSWLLAAGLATGCVTYPCEDDVLQCEEGEVLEVDANCEAEGPLTIEVLEMDTRAPVPERAWPSVHTGPQGGVHFNLALRVTGLEPDHVALSLRVDARECEDAECGSTTALGHRMLNADADLLEVEGDAFVLPDIVVMLERAPDADGRLSLEATDACGQHALVQRRPED